MPVPKSPIRLHKTYILRLLVDANPSGQPLELHGALQPLNDQALYPFKSGQGLLDLLQIFVTDKGITEQPLLDKENEP